jgi:GNAT superfamily N-acetyltransferase
MRRAFTFEDPAPSATARGDFETAFDETVGAGIASGRWTVWLAEAESEIVSHVYVGLLEKIPRPTREHRWIGYVTNVYTRPEQRGKGVGAALLERVTSWAAENDVELLVVWPSDESVGFYERAGFASGRDPLVWESGAHEARS